MSANDRMLLDSLLEGQRSDWSSTLSDDQAFEFFVCAQILKDYNISLDEVLTGIVGGSGDGGIDGVYTFLDDQLLAEDSAVFDDDFRANTYRRNVDIALLLVQAKSSTSFGEIAIDKVSVSARSLLNFDTSESDLLDLYSQELVNKVELFRSALRRLTPRFPKVKVHFIYASRGDATNVHPRVSRKANKLCKQFETMIRGTSGSVTFLGAYELWQLASKRPTSTLQLSYQDSMTSGNSHVALVTLRDYIAFLTKEDGQLRRHIFDWNVRDYLGNMEVTREIRQSLIDETAPNFWWLNNGVTMICSTVSSQGRTFTFEDVQIVNGLQTSYSIVEALEGVREDSSVLDRLVLVRILETEDYETRDKVIRATNKQTNVSAASLRATEDIQRQIELYLVSKQWFYERRKNYYRNRGKPKGRIVQIPFLAQTIMAIGLSRPNDARARPTSLLKSDADYTTVFAEQTPLPVYLWALKVQRIVNNFLQVHMSEPSERTNLRFHLAMLVTARLFGSRVYNPGQLAVLASEDPDIKERDLEDCLVTLRTVMATLMADASRTPEQIAKSKEFVEVVLRSEGF